MDKFLGKLILARRYPTEQRERATWIAVDREEYGPASAAAQALGPKLRVTLARVERAVGVGVRPRRCRCAVSQLSAYYVFGQATTSSVDNDSECRLHRSKRRRA